MNRELNIRKVVHEYNEVTFNEDEAKINGAKLLSGIELVQMIKNKEIHGDYPGGFVFIARIYEDGKVEGVNQFGHFDEGNCFIDLEQDLLHLKWTRGWINTITRAYLIDDKLVFFDAESGVWRTTFRVLSNS